MDFFNPADLGEEPGLPKIADQSSSIYFWKSASIYSNPQIEMSGLNHCSLFVVERRQYMVRLSRRHLVVIPGGIEQARHNCDDNQARPEERERQGHDKDDGRYKKGGERSLMRPWATDHQRRDKCHKERQNRREEGRLKGHSNAMHLAELLFLSAHTSHVRWHFYGVSSGIWKIDV